MMEARAAADGDGGAAGREGKEAENCLENWESFSGSSAGFRVKHPELISVRIINICRCSCINELKPGSVEVGSEPEHAGRN